MIGFNLGWKASAMLGTVFFWPGFVGLGAGAYKGYCAENGIAVEPQSLDMALQFGPAALGAAYHSIASPFSSDCNEHFKENLRLGAFIGGVPTVAGYIAGYIAGKIV